MMSADFSRLAARAFASPLVWALDADERAGLLERITPHEELTECDPADQAFLNRALAQVQAGESPAYPAPYVADWAAEDEAIGAQVKALRGDDVEWAGL